MPTTDGYLVSLAQVKAELLFPDPTAPHDQDTWLTDMIARGSSTAKTAFDRAFLLSTVTEFHTFDGLQSRVHLAEWPVVANTVEVWEDSGREYGDASKLVENTDYFVDYERGIVTKVSGAVAYPWEPGFASMKIAYRAGYDDSANTKVNIPADLRNVVLQFVVSNYRAVQARHRNEKAKGDRSGNKIASSIEVELPVAMDASKIVGLHTRVGVCMTRNRITRVPYVAA